jgi:TP901 family phage tail tape measure protein
MPIQVPVTQTGLEASIEAAAKRAGKSLKINLGTSAKSIEGLSQPLGRITGKADQFTKSMEAANARVLAFGASVGVLSAVTRGFQDLVRTTIEVEKQLASINSILNTSAKQLDSFKQTIFNVARDTEQGFSTVAEAALELSRQGLKAEEVTKRLGDSLTLARLSGLGAAEAVAGLTAAINSFNSTGITSAEVLNKLSAAAVSAAVSERDLIEGIKRSGSVAIQAGVSFDELVGVITAVQTKTARGGAVIGNSFKTIFTRIQSIDKLQTMQNLGVEITDLSGNVLSGTKLIENLAKALSDVPDARRLQIAENLVGKFQVAPFLAILDDYNSKTSKAIEVTAISQKATTEAYERNKALNQTLSAAINATVVSVQELANELGKIGVTDSLKNILNFFSGLVTNIQKVLEGEGIGGDFARGIVKGIGNVISGPGLAIFGAIIAKLTIDLVKFGTGSLKTFFGLNRAAKEQATLQGQIASTLLGNSTIQKQILAIENSQLSAEQKKAAQTKFFTTALNEQLAVMTRMQAISASIAPGVFAGTRRARRGGRAAGGFIPNYNAVLGYGSEQADINRGVGGAPKSARPVAIPNFNFGAGQKGTMVANTSEFMVPNFAGTGGSAIFNQDMVASMGLPSGAKRVGAAGGYIPNFAKKPINSTVAGMIIPRKGVGSRRATGTFGGNTFSFPVFGIDAAGEKVREEKDIKKSVERFSIGLATRESKSMTGGRPTAGKINRLANQGAIGGLAGAIFETALSSLLKSKDFDFGETATFDYVGQAAINNIGDISPALKGSGIKFLDAKIADNAGTRNSMAKKITSYFGASPTGSSIKGRGVTELMKASGKGQKDVLGALGMRRARGASGYIPNFAGPLQEAIARETAAGLPINQVRINQDASLRNSANPMGLAVTNTRDEPTGAIPNFRKKSTTSDANDAFGGMVGKLLAVQIGFSALSGVLGEVTEKNKLVSGSLSALNLAVSAALAAQAFGGLGNIGRFAIGRGAGAARGAAMMRTGRNNIAFAASDLAGARRGGLRGLAAGGGRLAARGGASALMGGLKVAGGALLRFAGPIGLATTVGLGLNSLFNKLNGTTDNLRKNEERLAEATKNATREFEELDLGGRKERESFLETSENLGERARQRLLDRGFQGTKDKKQAQDLGDLVTEAFKAGATSAEVEKIISTAEAQAGSRVQQTRMGSRTIDNVFSNQIADVMSQSLTNLANLDFSARQDRLQDFVKNTPGLRERLGSDDAAVRSEAEKQFTAEGKRLRVTTEGRAGTLQTIRKEIGAEQEEETKRINLINANIAKDALKSEIEIAKIKASALTTDQQKLKLAQSNKNLTGEQIAQLEGQIARSNNIKQGNIEVADVLIKQIDAVEKLALNDDQRLELQGKIREAGVEGLSEQGKFFELLDGILSLEQKSVLETEAISKNVEGTVSNIKKEVAARNLVLGITTKIATEQARIAELVRNSQSDLGIDIRRSSFDASTQSRRDRNDLNLRRGLVSADARLTDRQKANREVGFIEEENVLDIRDAEAEAVKSTSQEISNLVTVMPEFEGGIKAIVDLIQTGGFASLAGLDTVFFNELREQGVKPTPEQADAIRSALQTRDEGQEGVKLVKEEGETRVKLAKATRDNIDLFKTYSQLLAEFTLSLRQQAEQLKVDLVTARDGSSILSNINEQLFTAQARGGGAGAIAQASTDFAITGLQDQARLAGSSREARGFTRQIDIVREQLDLKRQFVELQKDEVVDVTKLQSLKERILELEKQRLQVNDSLRAKFEDEFIFSEKEIQDKLNDSLVKGARQFVDTLSDGLADAIAKGENLGDILKQAAADFFLDQAKSNFRAGFDNLFNIFKANTGGKVTGGSGVRDDVPALLTGGEFVMRRGAVDKYGEGFMSALNQGSVPTMNRGGLFTPGTFGQGAMRGKRSLLDFATQSFTTGAFDKFGSGAGFASIALEPQSAALTMFGRRNSPQFQKEQESKRKAFNLYTRQVQKEQEARERSGGLTSLLTGSILAGIAGFGFKELTDVFSKKSATGGSIPYAAGVDTVPTMLSGGEFIMNAAATQRIGRGTLSSINSGGGGGNGSGAIIGKLDELISVSDNEGETVINITVNSDGTSNESGNGNEEEVNLATRIRDVVKQVIDDEKRLGGSLRQARA